MSVRQKKLELIEAMNRARALEPSSFVPNKLLDTLIEKMHLKNDAELCRVLEVQPPIISKIRHRKLAQGMRVPLPQGGAPIAITVSIGLARHTSADTLARTLERADQALYAAKAQG
eukprot:gene33615-41476_t